MQGDTKCMQCLSCMHIRITIETLRHLYVTDQRTLITNNEKDEKDLTPLSS